MGMLDACKGLSVKRGTIVTLDQEEQIKLENVDIKILPVWKWLLSNQ